MENTKNYRPGQQTDLMGEEYPESQVGLGGAVDTSGATNNPYAHTKLHSKGRAPKRVLMPEIDHHGKSKQEK